MSTFEKIASAVIALLVVGLLILSYHELTERPGADNGPGPSFDQSVGQAFKLGPFGVVLNESYSGGTEQNCEQMQPVIIGVLHDIKERLEQKGAYQNNRDVFEVSGQTLQLFCNKNASVTLADPDGVKLLLTKLPFTRAIPPGGGPQDIGTDVRIDATVIAPGAVPPSAPTVVGEELIPDRFLYTATSSAS